MWVNRKYLSLLESELAYYRRIAESERARADRLHDALLVVHGELPATDTVIQASHDKSTAIANAVLSQQKQMAEMFSEAADEHADLIPPGMRADVEQLISG